MQIFLRFDLDQLFLLWNISPVINVTQVWKTLHTVPLLKSHNTHLRIKCSEQPGSEEI